jgi:hypothetical protein
VGLISNEKVKNLWEEKAGEEGKMTTTNGNGLGN